MENFTVKDLNNWDRFELYKLYTQVWTTVCFSVTYRLDVTKLVKECKNKGIKFTAAFIYAISVQLNQREEFRYGVKDGTLGVWDKIDAVFPVLNKNGQTTFHTLAAEDDFALFYKAYCKESGGIYTQTNAAAGVLPENRFIISVIPFMDFESLSFDYRNATNYYSPLLALGKFKGSKKITAPLSVTVNHAVMDGWHMQNFVDGLKEFINKPEEWCRQ
ncbi:MAG: chloramphenicol acetyltransferase [Clostridia bacterium]|nr:chloramphenicol acetyltransferase [Clostridia bacterium]